MQNIRIGDKVILSNGEEYNISSETSIKEEMGLDPNIFSNTRLNIYKLNRNGETRFLLQEKDNLENKCYLTHKPVERANKNYPIRIDILNKQTTIQELDNLARKYFCGERRDTPQKSNSRYPLFVQVWKGISPENEKTYFHLETGGLLPNGEMSQNGGDNEVLVGEEIKNFSVVKLY